MIIKLEKGQTYKEALKQIEKLLDENASDYKYLSSATSIYINLCNEKGEKFSGNNIEISIDSNGGIDKESEVVNDAVQKLIESVRLFNKINTRDFEKVQHKIELDEKYINNPSNDNEKRVKRSKLMEKNIEQLNMIRPNHEFIKSVTEEIDCNRFIVYHTFAKEKNIITKVSVSLVVDIEKGVYSVSGTYVPKQRAITTNSYKNGLSENVTDSIEEVRRKLKEL